MRTYHKGIHYAYSAPFYASRGHCIGTPGQ